MINTKIKLTMSFVAEDGKTLGRTQNAVPVVIKLKDPCLFPHRKQYTLKLNVKEGL